MKINTLLLLLCLPLLLWSQEDEKEKPKVKLSGFVKADYIFDSRQNVEGREGFYISYPKPIELDANGIDINKHPSSNQYGMTTRLGVTANGVSVLDADVMAFIEGDFTGPSNAHNNTLRLRHAYIKMDWSNTSLLMGQYWHPNDVPEMIPKILSLNTGAPMHSFSRGPQIRLTQMTGPLKWIAVAYAQRDFTSTGPEGPASKYLRDGIIPDLSLQAHYSNKSIFAGAGINYKRLHFRSFTIDHQLMSDDVPALSALAFVKIKHQNWEIRLQGVWGENLYDHLMLGGTAITFADSSNAEIEYSNISSVSAWSTLYYHFKKLKIGVFGGFAKNQGSKNEIIGPVYTRGADIDYVYRISPQGYYQIKNLIIANEWEYTVAAYGQPDSFGQVQDTYEVGNLRFTLSLIYRL